LVSVIIISSIKKMMGGSGDHHGNNNTSGLNINAPPPTMSPDLPAMTPSPPPVQQQPLKHAPLTMTGPPRLMALQEPQENFHKDEGGKANQLSFRIILQGELSPDILANAVDGCLPLLVRPVFDDGELADTSVLDVVGGTDGPNPCIQLRTRLGGVRYRLRTVSKRLGNRGIGVIVYLVGCPSIEPLRSEFTMVFSKRKNKEQRLEEQARERNELLERQRAAQLLLSARASPLSSEGPLLSPSNTGVATATAPEGASQLNASNSNGTSNTLVAQPPSSGSLKFPSSNDIIKSGLPPQFVQAAPAIVRPRPRRISRDKEPSSDSEDSDDSESTGNIKKKKARYSNGTRANNNQKNLEDRVAKLEAALEANIKEVEEMRAAMNLCFYQLGGNANSAGLRRSSSQNVPWEFSEPTPNFDSQTSARDQLVGGLTLVSPQPTRSPFEIDSWVNGGTLNGPDPSQPLRLRRDYSTGSVQVPSPRSTSVMGAPIPGIPKRSATSESLS
jgi:hypothetical protein